MIYPFKYNLSASSGFFRITISGSTAYFLYDIVNSKKPQYSIKENLKPTLKSETS